MNNLMISIFASKRPHANIIRHWDANTDIFRKNCNFFKLYLKKIITLNVFTNTIQKFNSNLKHS